MGASGKIDGIDMACSVFYRGMGAYLIGRMFSGATLVPLAIALVNTDDGIVVDGVLLNTDDVSILFSFTRSYFHVDVERPYDLIHFLKTILPHKRIAELYISTGFNKHGKTELYRELLDHMTPVVDAQIFEHLKFDTSCFSPQLLAELKQDAGRTVRIGNDYIIVDHAYVERRVTPLDIFLNEADEPEAQKMVIEWGNAIKDLAVSNIFPGDILLKNFGVTRHGRVVFYDYDELCLLSSCRFRKLPPAYEHENEMASEPWFYVDEDDVFPEEFQKFLGLRPPLRDVFCEHHNDLFEVGFWQQAQQMIRAGELPHIYPYACDCRLERK